VLIALLGLAVLFLLSANNSWYAMEWGISTHEAKIILEVCATVGSYRGPLTSMFCLRERMPACTGRSQLISWWKLAGPSRPARRRGVKYMLLHSRSTLSSASKLYLG